MSLVSNPTKRVHEMLPRVTWLPQWLRTPHVPDVS